MKLLLTGAAGFVGSHILEHLLKTTDANIICIDKLSYASMGFDRLNDIRAGYGKPWDYDKRVTTHTADITLPIPEGLAKEIGEVDIILHVAAESHVDNSISTPVPFIQNNVNSTIQMLEFARTQKKLSLFLYFSTDEVYGSAPEGYDYKEGDAHNSGNPYSASKAASEQICRAYSNTYKVPVVITNTMNVVGERQHPEKYLAKVIRYCLTKQVLPIHSNPERTKAGVRRYIHARNVADGITEIIAYNKERVQQRNTAVGVFNIVGEEELDNLAFAQIIAECVKKRVPESQLNYEMVNFHESRPGHDLRYGLDGTKMKEVMGWQPPKSLRESVDKVVDWYLKPENKKWLGM